jgi:hypothetical protein
MEFRRTASLVLGIGGIVGLGGGVAGGARYTYSYFNLPAEARRVASERESLEYSEGDDLALLGNAKAARYYHESMEYFVLELLASGVAITASFVLGEEKREEEDRQTQDSRQLSTVK